MRLPQPGELFEQVFRLDRVLGEGGAGIVFAAWDVRNGQPVAIKLLKPEGDAYDARTRQRFEREVAILARLRSPHTVTMLGHGLSADGLLYVVSEYVPGRELAALLAERRLDGPEVEHVLRQLLVSLREAHGLGLLHRDLKPENILVYPEGGDPLRVKLLDFGIARAFDGGSPALTRTGELVGTPRYMSPEQLTEKPLTPASDIYSLGLIAFEMALGRDALHGAAWGEQLERLMSGHVFSVPELQRIGPRLHAVITKMTARQPEHRYPSAAAVLAALDGPTAPVPARPIRTGLRAPRLATTSALLGAGTLGLIAFALHSRSPQAPAPPPVHRAPRVAGGSPARLPPEPQESPRAAGPSTTRDRGCTKAPETAPGRVEFPWKPTLFSDPVELAVYLPNSYDPTRPHPAVVILHAEEKPNLVKALFGAPQGSDDRPEPDVKGFIERSRWTELAEQEGFVVLGVNHQVFANDGRRIWQAPESREKVTARLKQAREYLCIDPGRVFAVGHYHGGRAVDRHFRCDDWPAAIATNSHITCDARACPDGTVRPFLMAVPLHTDHHRPSAACENEDATLDTIDSAWAAVHGCGARRRLPVEDGQGTCFTFDHCAVPLSTCHVDGGNPWTGFAPRSRDLDKNNRDGRPQDFPTERVMWEFFKALPPTAGQW